ncbi:adenylate/guanylate cyclase domain-containing protein [Hydrogenophaga sp.]|uniref:adenylate/guanylate cyclase domain-containing protein n=1 Tax=Hydrogenophaga sp. TaxID=1904254 RepID=UPI00272F8810|nr:adenylate/guanylate cyclase domain-containing protein [Hydrogenophaga sp.]MDP2017921.1 adenylate/guanylate cyclase domain-containing protein [Hydrogenophaga sp.]MDP3167893.1 adenylate/guanylate cyclase domain-containing protein [Hydrogenophaga sp.]
MQELPNHRGSRRLFNLPRGGKRGGNVGNELGEDPGLQAISATVMFVDVVESVRHIQRNEAGSVRCMRALMADAAQLVLRHKGQVVERLGDGLVLRFEHARHAAQCAVALHALAAHAGTAHTTEERMHLRAGIHSSPIWADTHGMYGLGVNLAARVAAVGGPGDTLLTAQARDQLVVGLDGDLHDLGTCYLKHVDEPLRLFRLDAQSAPLPPSLREAIAARMKTRPTLAVLPFELAQSAGPGRSPIGVADILSDQIIRQLSRSPMLHVISALSVNTLRGHGVELGTLYRTLGADYVLRGTLHTHDPADGPNAQLGLEVALWRAGAGEPVYAEVFQGTALDALSPTSELLGRLAHGVGARILAVEQRTARGAQALPNLASHTLYLNAVDLLHRFSLSDFDRAHQMLQALSERAPRHPEPLAWLARWHVFKVVQGWTDDSERDSAQALAFSERALERDPESALALTMAGSVHAGVKRDPVTAQRFYAQALEQNPNDSLAWLMSSVAHGFVMEREPAIAASEMALGLSPIDPARHFYDSLGATAAVMARDYPRGVALAQRAIHANAAHGSSYRALATAEMMLGEIDKAKATIARLLAVEPQSNVQTYLSRVGPPNVQNLEFAAALRTAGLPER